MNNDLHKMARNMDHEVSTNFGTSQDSQFLARTSNTSNVQIICRVNAPQRQNVSQLNSKASR